MLNLCSALKIGFRRLNLVVFKVFGGELIEFSAKKSILQSHKTNTDLLASGKSNFTHFLLC